MSTFSLNYQTINLITMIILINRCLKLFKGNGKIDQLIVSESRCWVLTVFPLSLKQIAINEITTALNHDLFCPVIFACNYYEVDGSDFCVFQNSSFSIRGRVLFRGCAVFVRDQITPMSFCVMGVEYQAMKSGEFDVFFHINA